MVRVGDSQLWVISRVLNGRFVRFEFALLTDVAALGGGLKIFSWLIFLIPKNTAFLHDR